MTETPIGKGFDWALSRMREGVHVRRADRADDALRRAGLNDEPTGQQQEKHNDYARLWNSKKVANSC